MILIHILVILELKMSKEMDALPLEEHILTSGLFTNVHQRNHNILRHTGLMILMFGYEANMGDVYSRMEM